MSGWTVELTRAAKSELTQLPDDMQARFLSIAGLLETFGPAQVGLPHVRPLESKLWEMRLKGRDGIARAVYFAHVGRRLVIMRVFVKKTEATPRHEIDLALKRMREFLDG